MYRIRVLVLRKPQLLIGFAIFLLSSAGFPSTSIVAQPASRDSTDARERSEESSAGDARTKADSSPNDELSLEALDLQLKLYGFVKADGLYSDNSVLTFGRENLLAPVQAKRRVQFDDAESRSQLIANQSRWGLSVSAPERLTAKIEFDFVGDYNQSQPNTGLVSRLRLAYLEYRPGPRLSLMAGQNWDIFSNLNPPTYNVTEVLFGGGNAGWIREQFALKYRPGSRFSFAAAIGNTTNNSSASPALGHELNGGPSFAARIEYQANDAIRLILSGILANVKYQQPLIEATDRAGDPFVWDPTADALELSNNLPAVVNGDYSIPINLRYNLDSGQTRRRQADGVAFGAQLQPTARLKFSFEGYYGRNMADIRTLALGRVQVRSKLSKLREDFAGYFRTADGSLDLTSESDPLAQFLNGLNDFESTWEAGGWAAVEYRFARHWEGRVFAGVAKIQNRDVLNTASAATLSRAQSDRTVWGATQLGAVFENQVSGFSLAWIPYSNFRIYFELERFRTMYYDNQALRVWRGVESIQPETGVPALRPLADYVPDYALPANEAEANVYRLGTMIQF